jgi:hypothetical protein
MRFYHFHAPVCGAAAWTSDVKMWVATGFQATTAFLWWENRFNPGPLLVGYDGQVSYRTTLVVAFQCTNQSWYHDDAEFPNALLS